MITENKKLENGNHGAVQKVVFRLLDAPFHVSKP